MTLVTRPSVISSRAKPSKATRRLELLRGGGGDGVHLEAGGRAARDLVEDVRLVVGLLLAGEQAGVGERHGRGVADRRRGLDLLGGEVAGAARLDELDDAHHLVAGDQRQGDPALVAVSRPGCVAAVELAYESLEMRGSSSEATTVGLLVRMTSWVTPASRMRQAIADPLPVDDPLGEAHHRDEVVALDDVDLAVGHVDGAAEAPGEPGEDVLEVERGGELERRLA